MFGDARATSRGLSIERLWHHGERRDAARDLPGALAQASGSGYSNTSPITNQGQSRPPPSPRSTLPQSPKPERAATAVRTTAFIFSPLDGRLYLSHVSNHADELAGTIAFACRGVDAPDIPYRRPNTTLAPAGANRNCVVLLTPPPLLTHELGHGARADRGFRSGRLEGLSARPPHRDRNGAVGGARDGLSGVYGLCFNAERPLGSRGEGVARWVASDGPV